MNYTLTVRRRKERRNSPVVTQMIQLDASTLRDARKESRRVIHRLNYRSNIDDGYTWLFDAITHDSQQTKALQ